VTNPLGSLVLGAILSIIGGFFGQEYGSWRQQGRTRKLLCVLLTHEIHQMNRIVDKLIEAYERTNVAYNIYLAELGNARTSYDRNSDWIILFDEGLRQDIFDYFNKEQLTRGYLVNLNQAVGTTTPTPQYLVDEIRKQIQAFKEMRTLGEKILPRVSFKS